MVKKEAFRWKRLGVDTLAAAEEFLAKQEILVGREREILPLLGIKDRAPVERERQYIEGWVDMGFTDDAIRLYEGNYYLHIGDDAYKQIVKDRESIEKTLFPKQESTAEG